MYRFGLALFLKRPSVFPYSTRSPPLVKNIRSLVQNLARSPLSSIKIETAVLSSQFCMLDPRSKVYLRFSPRFLQKTPRNLVFLAEKQLDFVLGLVYAF